MEDEVLTFTDSSHSNPICNELDDFFSKEEVAKVCSRLKKNKAAGIDGITNKLLTLAANTDEGRTTLGSIRQSCIRFNHRTRIRCIEKHSRQLPQIRPQPRQRVR